MGLFADERRARRDDDTAASMAQFITRFAGAAIQSNTKNVGQLVAHRGCCSLHRSVDAARGGPSTGVDGDQMGGGLTAMGEMELRRDCCFWIGGLGAGTWTPWLQSEQGLLAAAPGKRRKGREMLLLGGR
jgi:hypothetical protein